jgi:hypothetical protein
MEVNMKSKKWIWVTLAILLTLVVLAGVAGAGFRMGLMQGTRLTASADGSAPQFEQFGHMRGFDGNFDGLRSLGPRMQGFDHDGFGGGRGGFISPLFGLIKFAVLAALFWLGFNFIRKSGWRLTRTAPQPAPAASEVPAAEKKDEA